MTAPSTTLTAVWERLRQSVQPDPDQPGRWAHADPYLLQHAIRHAADAGWLPGLLGDPEFLVYASPAEVAAELHRAPDVDNILPATIYRASFRAHHTLSPDQRRQILAVDAARFGDTTLAGQLAQPWHWAVRWATGGQVTPSLSLTMTGHEGTVSSVATYLHDGRPYAVTSADDHQCRVWDLDTGVCTHVLTGHTERVSAVTVTHLNGRPHAITTGDDETIRTWDLLTGTPTSTITAGHGRFTWVTALNLDGRPHAATAGVDHTVRIWDLADGSQRAALNGHTGIVTTVAALTIDNRPYLASASHDSTARIWDPMTGTELATLTGHTEVVSTVTLFEQDNRLHAVTAGHDLTIRIWDITTGATTATLLGHTRAITAVTVGNVDGRPCLVSTGADSTIRVWDIDDGSAIATMPCHTSVLTDVALQQVYGRARALVVGGDETFRVVDLTAAPLPHTTLPGHTNAVARIATSGPVVMSASWDGTVRIWDPISGQSRQLQPDIGGLPDAELTRPGTPLRVAGIGNRGTAFLWTPDTDQLTTIDTGHDANTLAVALADDVNGDLLMLTGGHDNTIRVRNLSRPTPVTVLTGHEDTVSGISAIRLDNEPHAVTTAWDSTVRVWNILTGTQRTVLHGHDGTVNGVTTGSVNGRPYALSTGHDQTARLWDLHTGEQLAVYTGHAFAVPAATVITYDGRPCVATVSWDRTIRIHSLAGTLLDEIHLADTLRAIAATDGGSLVVGMGWEVLLLDPRRPLPSGPALLR